MKRVLVVMVAGVLLALGLAGPAEAAQQVRPSAPRSVAAKPGQGAGELRVSWAAPKSRGSSAVEAYAVTYTDTAHPNAWTWTVVGAKQRSVVLHGIDPARSWVVRVAAYNRWGRGPWARVEVAATTHAEALFAVDEQAHTLVRYDPTGHAAPVTALSGVSDATDLEVDAGGTAYVAAGGTVRKVPRTGAVSVVGPGSQVETDAAGNVYLGGASGVVRITPDGHRTTVTTSSDGTNLAVDAKGTVTTSSPGYLPVLTTYASGAAPVERRPNVVRGGPLLVDSVGTLYDNANSGGGAQYGYWLRIASGSVEGTTMSTRMAEYGAAVAADDSFYVAQSGSWCPAISVTCTPDLEVRSVARFAPDGHLVSDVATSGFSMRRSLGVEVAADSTGALFAADRGVGDKPGLVRVPPAGGAAQRVADGTFSLVAVG